MKTDTARIIWPSEVLHIVFSAQKFKSHWVYAARLVRHIPGAHMSDPGGVAVRARGSWTESTLTAMESLFRDVGVRMEARIGRDGVWEGEL